MAQHVYTVILKKMDGYRILLLNISILLQKLLSASQKKIGRRSCQLSLKQITGRVTLEVTLHLCQCSGGRNT